MPISIECPIIFLNKVKIMYYIIANNMMPLYTCDLFQNKSESIINTTLGSVSDEIFLSLLEQF